jgi:hypothetical protein
MGLVAALDLDLLVDFLVDAAPGLVRVEKCYPVGLAGTEQVGLPFPLLALWRKVLVVVEA